MLYALSLGVCDNPLDENELPFVYEKNLRVLPSMSSVLASSDLWIANKAFGVNFVKLLHGEQRARYISPLPPSAELRGEYRIGAVVDKGAGKGALVYFEKILSDNKTGDHLCTVSSTIFLRGDGGAGGFGEAASAPIKYYKGRYTEGGLRAAAFVHYPAVVAGGEVSNAFMTMMDISPNNSGELKIAVR